MLNIFGGTAGRLRREDERWPTGDDNVRGCARVAFLVGYTLKFAYDVREFICKILKSIFTHQLVVAAVFGAFHIENVERCKTKLEPLNVTIGVGKRMAVE